MSTLQTIFNIAWLTSLLVLLFLIWRSSEKRLKHIQKMEITMFDVSKQDAESARKAVDACYLLIETMKQKEAK